ncbi:MAG: hypothetical protein GX895_13965 [Clostridiales bacterium]|uniref:hypothetical protein n=1 Tax=Clostridium sp. N3C TaxID=1776758 RepID=UPI00092DFC65|nr:hypothetical protein [Clostridium sp. N3C]NLZ49858.1 hypothetical protein [Clostridiales bacterium]SCN23247.1 hypothetical protein N3C_1204 [Clostridium sp. N3C]
MKVIASREAIEYLKDYLKDKEKNAVRFQLCEVCCGTAEMEMVYDRQKDDDECYELEGIKFVASKDFSFLVGNVYIEKTEHGVDIKKNYNY